MLAPDYLAAIPTAPGAEGNGSGYEVAINPENNKMSVRPLVSELDETIVVNPLPEQSTFAVSAGGADFDNGYGVASYADGGSVVTGGFSGTATFGEGANQVNLTSSGSNDVFIAKYASDGTLEWAERAGGTSFDEGIGVASYADGGSVVTGYFEGTATFGEGANQVNLTSAGTRDIFIGKYASDGTLEWAERAGGTSSDIGMAVASYADGGSVVTGYFQGTATFGEGANQVNLTSAGSFEIFIAKYAADGTLEWAERAGGNVDDYGYGVASFTDGGSVVTGYFEGTATFGEGANQVNLTSAGTRDLFIVKYSSDGALE